MFNVAAAINFFHYNQHWERIEQKIPEFIDNIFSIVLFICNCLIKHFIMKPELIKLKTK